MHLLCASNAGLALFRYIIYNPHETLKNPSIICIPHVRTMGLRELRNLSEWPGWAPTPPALMAILLSLVKTTPPFPLASSLRSFSRSLSHSASLCSADGLNSHLVRQGQTSKHMQQSRGVQGEAGGRQDAGRGAEGVLTPALRQQGVRSSGLRGGSVLHQRGMCSHSPVV